MKKKGPKSIPDFSRKKAPSRTVDAPAAKPAAPGSPRVPVVKPQATSQKSGRRGT